MGAHPGTFASTVGGNSVLSSPGFATVVIFLTLIEMKASRRFRVALASFEYKLAEGALRKVKPTNIARKRPMFASSEAAIGATKAAISTPTLVKLHDLRPPWSSETP